MTLVYISMQTDFGAVEPLFGLTGELLRRKCHIELPVKQVTLLAVKRAGMFLR